MEKGRFGVRNRSGSFAARPNKFLRDEGTGRPFILQGLAEAAATIIPSFAKDRLIQA